MWQLDFIDMTVKLSKIYAIQVEAQGTIQEIYWI